MSEHFFGAFVRNAIFGNRIYEPSDIPCPIYTCRIIFFGRVRVDVDGHNNGSRLGAKGRCYAFQPYISRIISRPDYANRSGPDKREENKQQKVDMVSDYGFHLDSGTFNFWPACQSPFRARAGQDRRDIKRIYIDDRSYSFHFRPFDFAHDLLRFRR